MCLTGFIRAQEGLRDCRYKISEKFWYARNMGFVVPGLKSSKASFFFIRLMGLVVGTFWLFFEVNGLLPQIQITITGGLVIVRAVFIKITLVIFLLLLFIIRHKISLPASLIYGWLSFLSYLFFVLLIRTFQGVPFTYILASFNAYYFFIIVLPLLFLTKGMVRENTAILLLSILATILSVVGSLQSLTSDPLLATHSLDDYFKVNSWNFHGKVRAFSFFSSGLSFGQFLILIAQVLIVVTMQPRISFIKRISAFVLLLLVFATTFLTYTRVVYLQSIFSTLFTLVYILLLRQNYSRKEFFVKRAIQLSPLVYGLVGIVLTFIIYILMSTNSQSYFLAGSSPLFSENSFKSRLAEWSFYGSEQWLSSAFSFLFGTGYFQSDRFLVSSNPVIIDNAFLAVGVHIGFFGLVLWTLLMWEMWKIMSAWAMKSPSPMALGVLAYASTWPILGMFNIITYTYVLALWLLLLTTRSNKN